MIRLPIKIQKPPDLGSDDETLPLDMQGLIRLGMWGGAAAAGLLFIAIAAFTDAGQRRLSAAFQGGHAPTQVVAFEDERRAIRDAQIENHRLATQLRNLSEDRDRLLARVTVLERNYEDVTGSISKLSRLPELKPAASVPQVPAPQAAAPPAPAPQVAAPAAAPQAPVPQAVVPQAAAPQTVPQAPIAQAAAAPPPPEVASVGAIPAVAPERAAAPVAPRPAPPSVQAAFPVPPPPVPMVAPAPPAAAEIPTAPQPAPVPDPAEGGPARTEFGVDLGGAPNVAALRNVWERVRRTHSSSLEGLRPVIGIRDGRSGQVELRLVVGPISNAANAAKLCATLAMGGLSCQATTFDGQRLALR
ncbi:MAG: hypothetical protein ABW198_04100 [Pseudorhodoplanes sp.]